MILLYHKIYPDSPTVFWVDVNNFYRQMCEIEHKKIVYLSEYDPEDESQVVITFDGIYKNVLEYAAPILKEFGYPFELFIVGNYVGKDNVFDSSEPRTFSAAENELQELVTCGGRLEWHTNSHPNFAHIDDEAVIEKELEIAPHLKALDRKGFKFFAFPHGKYNEKLMSLVKRKFHGAVAYIEGDDRDRWRLTRKIVTNATSLKKHSISVIIPSYKYGCFLAEAIESVLKQTRPADEVIIADDASPDNTGEIAGIYQQKYPALIKYVRNDTNLGIVGNFNKAIGQAEGDYICFLGADNRFRSDYIEKTARVLDADDEVAIAYTDFAMFGARAKMEFEKINKQWRGAIKEDYYYIVNFPEFNEESIRILDRGLNFIHGSSMYRKQLAEAVGGYKGRENAPEDYSLFYRIIKSGWKAKRVPYPLLEYRQHSFDQANNALQSYMELKLYKNLVQSLTREKNRIHKLSSRLIDVGKTLLHQGDINNAREIFTIVQEMFPEIRIEITPSPRPPQTNASPHVAEKLQKIKRVIEQGDLDQAEGLLRDMIKKYPRWGRPYCEMGRIFYNRGEKQQALSYLEKASELEPGEVLFRKKLAHLYAELGNPQQALRQLHNILQINPGDVEALVTLGRFSEQLGKDTEARIFYERALSYDRDNEEIKDLLDTVTRRWTPLINDENPKTASPEGVPSANKPRVSIIIPVHNNLDLTQKCISSIEKHTGFVDYEIIIVDNGSNDGTESHFERMNNPRLQYVRLDSNLGFVGGCNFGASKARGEYIVFLNNDTEVTRRWIESLLETFDRRADCGIVGSKLVYPDGTLQEAGGIIFSDGNGWNYGRGMNPDDPRFNFEREVDYCSGAAIIIRKCLWDGIGGFDERYAPAYYEDTDLCFEARKRGYKVYYQPQSIVIHHEGKTAGTDLSTGFKRYQAINRRKFVEKWSEELKSQYPNDGKHVIKASTRGTKGSILVINYQLPMFDRASGSLRLFNILKLLKKMGFHVSFFSIGKLNVEKKYMPILEHMGIETFPPDYFISEGKLNVDDFSLFLKEKNFDYVAIEFWSLAKLFIPMIRKIARTTRIIVDTVDIHFVREIREAELANNNVLLEKALAKKEEEISTYKLADRLWVVTDNDKKAIRGYLPGIPIDIVTNVHERIDLKKSFDDTSGLLFVGNFDYPPNRDAVFYLCREIFPLIVKELRNVTLFIVGTNPQDDIKALATQNIIVTGYVEDLSPYLLSTRVSVSPLRYGAGMKGKIGEALSWGLPVVTTSIGAEGMDLTHEEDVLIADTPETFAQAVVRLYQDRALWERLSHMGKMKVERLWSPEAVEIALRDIFAQSDRTRREAVTSIVLLTMNAEEYTKHCIESILRHTRSPFELIIVDNGSTDGTKEYIRSIMAGRVPVAGVLLRTNDTGEVISVTPASPTHQAKNKRRHSNRPQVATSCRRIVLIENKNNRGFAAGNNQGIAASRGDYILLMNNDVVVTPGWLERMIATADSSPRIGIVGPMSNHISGPQQVPPVQYNEATLVGLEDFAAAFARAHAGQSQHVWRVVGFCMLIKRTVIDKIGGLDERYKLGNFEDDDFSLRAGLAGFESRIAQDCFIHHFGGRTFAAAGIDYRESLHRNWELFKTKWRLPDLPYGTPYDVREVFRQEFTPDRHFFPISPEGHTVERGERLFAAGDVIGARLCFERVLDCYPHCVEAMNNLGYLAFQEGDYDQARSWFNRGLALDPDHDAILENLAQLFIHQENYATAIPYLERLVTRQPEHVGFINTLAHCHVQLGNLAQAKELYRRSIALDETQTPVRELLELFGSIPASTMESQA